MICVEMVERKKSSSMHVPKLPARAWASPVQVELPTGDPGFDLHSALRMDRKKSDSEPYFSQPRPASHFFTPGE